MQARARNPPGSRDDRLLLPAERATLDERGFVVLTDVIPDAWLGELRAAFEHASETGASTGRKEPGTRHVECELAPGSPFLGVLREARVLAAVEHVLARPFRLFQLGGRDPGAGHGLQGLHADWPARSSQEPPRIVTSLWLLDDFLATNGATRVVPGTQRLPHLPPRRLADPAAHHPDELVVTAPAGAVLVFNGHLWHSGTRNASGRSRRVLQGIFGAREQLWHGGPPRTPLDGLEPSLRGLLTP